MIVLEAQQKGVVQCATFEEFQAVRKAWGLPEEKILGRRRYVENGSWVCVRGSVGKVWAAATAEFAIHQWQPRALVDFGAAGALVPTLATGDIVVASQVIEHDVESALALKKPSVKIAIAAALYQSVKELADIKLSGAVHHGIIASGDRDIHTLEQRRKLAAETGAIAATWESSAIGRVAGFHGIPFYCLRVITDTGLGINGSMAVGDSAKEFIEEYSKSLVQVLDSAAQLLKKICV